MDLIGGTLALTLPSPPGEGFHRTHFQSFVHPSDQSSVRYFHKSCNRFPVAGGEGRGGRAITQISPFLHKHHPRPAPSVSAVAMPAATAATAPTGAGIATAAGGAVTGAGRGEHGEFLGELGRTAMRAAGTFPIGRTDEDLAVAFAFGTMKFVDRHGHRVNPAGPYFKMLDARYWMLAGWCLSPAGSSGHPFELSRL